MTARRPPEPTSEPTRRRPERRRPPIREWTIDATDAGTRLDKWLASRTEAGSRGRASEWIARGKVYLDGEPAGARAGSHALAAGQRVGLWLDRPGSARTADRAVADARPLLRIVHQDAAIVVVNKPAGLLVEPLPHRADEEATLLDLVADHFRHAPRARSYVVHRIDRDTSGLVLFARTLAVRDALKTQFEKHSPDRVYLAVVLGAPTPASGTWRDQLAWDPTSLRQRQAHATDARGKAAEARYQVTETFGSAAARVEVTLVTGKRNQIRVQAAMRGHPVLGERQYRFSAPPEPASLPHIDRQALHAWKLGFVHPVTGRRVKYEAPLPEDLKRLLAALRRAQPPKAG